MGFFLSSVRQDISTLQSRVTRWSEPLERVKQYHGIFKSVCDNFVIRRPQFSQIFGSQQKLSLWTGSESVNALEIFCGLVYYARQSTFRSKLKFLFLLFDFNEIKSISIVDLQYMILSICNFTYKLLGKNNTKADELKLAEWLVQFRSPRKRINVTQLYGLCTAAGEIKEFLRLSRIEVEEEFWLVGETARNTYEEEDQLEEEERIALKKTRRENEITGKLNWFGNFSQKLTKPKYKKESVSNTALSWVYGIQLNRLSKPFKTLQNSRIIYAISAKIIVFSIAANSQKIYSQHQRQIECFCAKQSDNLVASSEGVRNSIIHLWNMNSLQTRHILHVDHPHRIHLLSFSLYSNLLTVVGEREQSPIHIYDSESCILKSSFSLPDRATDLLPLFSPLGRRDLPNHLGHYFIFSSQFKITVVDENCSQYSHSFDSEITSLAVVYLNPQEPYLRCFKMQRLALQILTGHQNGSIFVSTFNENAEEVIVSSKEELLNMGDPIKQLAITSQSLLFVSGQELKIYDLNILVAPQEKSNIQEERIEEESVRTIRLSEVEGCKLLSSHIRHFDLSSTEINLITEEGDFLVVGDRQIIFDGYSFHEQQNIRRINSLVKFSGEMRAICFAERELKSILLIVSERRRIYQISPDTHEVFLVVDISYEDSINVIDSAVSEEGVGYMIYGCRSGKLLIRSDWEEVARVYDCSAEITDLKISNDTSYLLVSTITNLMFFQLTPSFSSPRKITFENESPVCINFLDNFKFCSVSTSARNVYLIEIPQLKHRNIQKENETFSITKMEVNFPNYADEAGKDIRYTKCLIGGDMKFYLLTLTTGQFLYFSAMSSLVAKNYLVFAAHQCEISNVVVAEGQDSFYTLGKNDQMLLEWTVSLQRPPFHLLSKQSIKKSIENRTENEKEEFKRIKHVSEVANTGVDYRLSTFFFRGTNNEKLNARMHKSLALQTESYNNDELDLMKRHCNFTLETRAVYGLECDKVNQVRYLSRAPEDKRILHSTSRFLVESLDGKCQKIHQTSAHKIGFFTLSDMGEIIYSECGPNPQIHTGNSSLQTTHKQGIIHFTLHRDLILSYGISNDSYTLNLHHLRTGELLVERTTNHEIMGFVMISEHEFISFNEVRKWQRMVESESLALAASAVLLSNERDVCLGGLLGELSILSENGIYEVASNAHSKAIIVMKLNLRDHSFELITASLDETLKIWNEYFEQLVVINLAVDALFTPLKTNENNQIMTERNPKPGRIVVKSIDCKNNRILISLSYGEIWEYLVTSNVDPVLDDREEGTQLSVVSETEQNISQEEHPRSQKMQLNYRTDCRKLLDAHCSQSPLLHQRFIVFDIHSQLPVLVSAGNDGKLTFLNYETDTPIANYLCEIDEKVRIRALKFASRGRMLVVGMSNGLLLTYFMEIVLDSCNCITELKLNYFQVIRPDSAAPILIQAIEFNANSDVFAVSCMYDTNASRRQLGSGELKEGESCIKCFKMKSERNQNADEAFYEYKDTITLKEDEKLGNKYSKCVFTMHFLTQEEKNYLLLFEEYIGEQGERLPNAKGRHSVYCLEDKSYLVDEFSVDWLNANFSSLLHLQLHDTLTEEQSHHYTITSMVRYEDSLIYGGVDGRLHLVALGSLDVDAPIKDYKLTDMCLSRIFSSHTSPIVDLKLAGNHKKYLFVSGYTDECLVKYELIMEDRAYFLEHQTYPRELSDDNLHGECVSKAQFYLMVNNRQPLRQEISNILQDVQPCEAPSVHFSIARVFGRRASDRRYNLAYFQTSALYSLGPNIVIQNIKNPALQELMPADPSPLSHCPQISTFHYNDRFLILATEEECSCLFVWDIKSKSCIRSLKIDCSFVYGLRFAGERHAVFYGVNDKFELVVGLVDWTQRQTIGRMRLAYSGNWTVRDICTVRLKGDDREFVTCGHLHLCYWEMRGDTLIYRNFNSQLEARYLCVRELNGYLVTGCEDGHLYLWADFQLLHKLPLAHQAAVRCLEVDTHNDLLLSGGKDGLILLLKVDDSKLALINRIELNKTEDISRSFASDCSHPEKSYRVEFQIQSLCANPLQVSEDYETLLVGTRSGNIYEIRYSESSDSVCLLFENHDYQSIVSVCFSQFDQDSFYTLTNAGIIERWSLTNYAKLLSFDLGQRALQLEASGEYLLACCRHEVLVYAISKENNLLLRRDELCLDTRRADYQPSENKDSEIIKFCLSRAGRSLAVCVKICAKQPIYLINLYELGKKDYLYQVNNLKHELDYLDFSSDEKYLLFKDKYEEIGMINLQKDYRRINTIFLEMNIEWQQEGLRISPKAQKIYYSYSCENKITAITRLGSDRILVGDEMGTLRLFDYPSPDRLGELHLRCYTPHMNDITALQVHPAHTHAISTALHDRSLILWRIHRPPDPPAAA